MSKKNVTSQEKNNYEGETEIDILRHKVHMLIKPQNMILEKADPSYVSKLSLTLFWHFWPHFWQGIYHLFAHSGKQTYAHVCFCMTQKLL